MSGLAGERYPRVVVFFRIFFERPLSLDVFSMSQMLSQKGSALIPRESERNTGTRCQYPEAYTVLGSGGIECNKPNVRISIHRYSETKLSFPNVVRRKTARQQGLGVENWANV